MVEIELSGVISEFSEIDYFVVSDNEMVIIFFESGDHIVEYLFMFIIVDFVAHDQILSLGQLEIVVFEDSIGVEHPGWP